MNYASVSDGWPIAGDINYDGAVNTVDLLILADDWLSDSDRADVSKDNSVNLSDMEIVARDWLEALEWAK